MSEELCARLECIEKLVLVLTAQRNQLQENVVEMESAKLKARNATVLIEAERDQLRARVAELERACFEAAAFLRNDLYVNRVTNALAVLDEAQLSE